jgi:hypothetical protein
MVVIRLENLKPSNPQVQAITPTIDVDRQGVQSLPTSCQSILSTARMSGSSSTFFDSIQLTSKYFFDLRSFSSQLKSYTIDQNQVMLADSSFQKFIELMRGLYFVEIPKYRLIQNCLKEANQIKVNDYDEQKARTEESKLRLDSMLHPEESVSYYEGWFPLFRPMKEQTLFALFGTALFLLLFSIWILLKFNGFEFNISLPGGVQVGGVSQYQGYLIGGAVVGLVVGVIGSLRGWFS